MHHLCVVRMVIRILAPIPHPNRVALQFICFGGKGMRLEIMNHLQFVFDVA